MTQLLIATNNQGKLLEILSLLGDLEVQVITPAQLGLDMTVKEDGLTYAENAALKALTFAYRTNLLTLADDSGLEVAALGGLPGLHSARFDPKPGATDADRRKLLLQRLRGHPRPWTAQFCCVVALATPKGDIRFAEGICPGEIIPHQRGHHGFGYDPLFLVSGMELTMAELSMDEKNRLSHRARAIQAARPLLLELLAKS